MAPTPPCRGSVCSAEAGKPQCRRWRSFLMISRRSAAYSSITRRASSKRDGLGMGASLSERGV